MTFLIHQQCGMEEFSDAHYWFASELAAIASSPSTLLHYTFFFDLLLWGA